MTGYSNYSLAYLTSFFETLNPSLKNSYFGKECEYILNFKNQINLLNKDSVLINTVVKDSTGKSIKILDLLEVNKKTIFVVTSDHCHYCIGNTNELIRLISENNSTENYQVITFNTDDEFDVWSKKKYKSTNYFKNYFLPKGFRNEFCLMLDIASNPYNLLFDNSTLKLVQPIKDLSVDEIFKQ